MSADGVPARVLVNLTIPALAGLVLYAGLAFAQTVPVVPEVRDYFSSNYSEARVRFIRAARSAGARIESIRHPLSGPAGESLYTDVATLGAEDAKRVLVLGSGTHGVEGFAGSAIQAGLLEEGLSPLGADVRVVLIHAINPYGFAHLRRVDEDNVDLNRNFLDHTKSHPSNQGYEALADALAPRSISIWQNLASRMKLGIYLLKHGSEDLRRAISQGQYTHPDGLFYGGRTDAWSNTTLRGIVQRHLADAGQVIFVDFHTGLGDYGSAEVIVNAPPDSTASRYAARIWPGRVRTTVTGESVSVHVRGPLKLAVADMLPSTRVIAVALEFGTLPPMDVLWALRAENWLAHHGDTQNPENKEIKSKLLRAFYPSDVEWRLRIWREGKSMVRKALVHIERAPEWH